MSVALILTPLKSYAIFICFSKPPSEGIQLVGVGVENCKAGFVLGLHASDQPTAASQLAAGVGPGKSRYVLDSLIDSCAPLILCLVLMFNSIGEGYGDELPAQFATCCFFDFGYRVVSECQALRQSDCGDSFYIRNHVVTFLVHHRSHYSKDAYIWIYIWRVTSSLLDSICSLHAFSRSLTKLLLSSSSPTHLTSIHSSHN